MFDIKAYSPQNHIKITGKSNETILENFRFLASHNKIYEVRTVVMKGIIDFENEVKQIREFINQINPEINHRIIPFRAHGTKAQKFKELE
jgi:pyruvate-formate lyase-activating enzyme